MEIRSTVYSSSQKPENFSQIEQAFNRMLNYSQDLKIEAYELKLEKKGTAD